LSGEANVQGIALQSGWETFLLAAPIVGMVLIGVFRLDVVAANASRTPHPGLPGNDENGQVLMSDPDGRPWNNSSQASSGAN
jgi:hypothetical protein